MIKRRLDLSNCADIDYLHSTIQCIFHQGHHARVAGDSSIKKACENLKTAYPDITWKEGKLLNRVSKKELETWVKAL